MDIHQLIREWEEFGRSPEPKGGTDFSEVLHEAEEILAFLRVLHSEKSWKGDTFLRGQVRKSAQILIFVSVMLLQGILNRVSLDFYRDDREEER